MVIKKKLGIFEQMTPPPPQEFGKSPNLFVWAFHDKIQQDLLNQMFSIFCKDLPPLPPPLYNDIFLLNFWMNQTFKKNLEMGSTLWEIPIFFNDPFPLFLSQIRLIYMGISPVLDDISF